MKRSLLILFCLCLSGCSFSPALIDPYSYAPKNSRSVWTSERKSCLVSSNSCDIFLPEQMGKDKLTLGELIDIALHNSPGTKTTWAEARAQAALYGQSLSPYFPEVTANTAYVRQHATLSVTENVITSFLQTTITPEVNISYTLLDFGQRRHSSEAARQMLYYADLTHNREIQSVIQMVMNSYYDYLYKLEQLSAYEANLETAQVTLVAAENKLRYGVASLGDVSTAKTRFLQAKINTIRQKRSVENSFAELAKNAGLPANINFSVEQLPENTSVDLILNGVDELICQAQKQRQDFLASVASLRAKEAELLKAKSMYYPTITGDLNAGKTWYNDNDPEKYHWSFQFSLNIPIFKGFYYRNNVKKAAAEVEKSQAELLEKELNMVQEITTSHFDVKSAAEDLRCSEDYLREAKEQLEIQLSNYQAGVNTILDLLAAQSSLADARSKLADSKKSWYTSLANLAYATGALCSQPACGEGI